MRRFNVIITLDNIQTVTADNIEIDYDIKSLIFYSGSSMLNNYRIVAVYPLGAIVGVYAVDEEENKE